MSPLALPNSLWAATAEAPPEATSLDDQVNVDVAIVGAGFNGLRAALVLAEAGKKVAVVDAGEIGWGASGRNGGQVNPIGHESPETIRNRWGNRYGNDMVDRYTRFISDSADSLFELARNHHIHCDAEQNGWIRAVHGNAAIKPFEELYQGWTDAGSELRLIDKEELSALSGTEGYLLGWVAPQGGSIQPLSFARGLAHAAKAAGANLYSQTHVEKLIPSKQGGWQLASKRGLVTADQVLLCTNGYTDKLFPGIRETIVPVVSIQAATAPLTEHQNAHILPDRHTFADTRRVIFYFRKTADNRLVFGSAGTGDELPNNNDRQRIKTGLKTVFPRLPDLTIDYIWGGRIAVTQDHLPHIHNPAPGLYTALGCNGRGVALSTAMGRLLADLTLGRDPESLPIPITQPRPYPFHRFHRIGIKIAVPWKQFCDNREVTRE
ncbi:MAG: FAD-dependent oxidoreductase [Gammaproteobacteria bacterium]|nr:FAD-dependent oxidoreductase [Gammaproteobacteria bacterium]